ncbi:hypothetical protein RJ639_043909 [Escallonia herrerae]|uniref:Uncharacterized protein n=1 Tax=Escallonia herrerae TaxID=1293975 RepID=A0AA89B502_9ASTE|nr:hypothetical protein RJ639_043909 [Escallonia herrerae]
MRPHFRTLAALLLAVLMILHSWPKRAEATTRLLLQIKPQSSLASSEASSSQTLRDVQADKKDPMKQVDSSFRKIPPSRSNPTQNKCEYRSFVMEQQQNCLSTSTKFEQLTKLVKDIDLWFMPFYQTPKPRGIE